ncbi:hypothetical protein SLE2022_098790 [Rubroshorea leprosula]
MIGSFLTRGLVMVLGYAYPAYECYKTVEKNKPEIEQLRFWCQYWILVAVLSVCERIGDAFISWVPMYSEAKLAFFVYLWYPKTRGTTYVYDSFFRPYVAKHENEIDRNLLELRTRAGDMAVLYWHRAASYGQTRVFDILQYIASQSTPRPHPAQNPQRKGTRDGPQSSAPNPQAPSKPQPETEEEPPSPTSSTSSSQHQKEVAEEVGPSEVPKPPNPETVTAPNSPNKKTNAASQRTQTTNAASQRTQTTSAASQRTQTASAASESTSEPTQTLAEAMQMEPTPPSGSESINLPPKETIMDETIRRTRGGLRKTRSAVTR